MVSSHTANVRVKRRNIVTYQCLKMLRHNDWSISLQQPASPFNQYVLSKFLKIRPKILGVFEISIGLILFVITIYTGLLYFLWVPFAMFLTGAVTVSAARTCSMCWVKASQFMNCVSAIMAAISILLHFFVFGGITVIVLLVCDILILIFSIILASTSCECCRTKPRHVTVSYVNTAVPNVTDNNFVVLSQHCLYAPPPNYDSDPFTPPPNYSKLPSAPPPNYDPGVFAPPPNYDPGVFAPPPNYSTLPSPPNFDPGPSAPSLNYHPVSPVPPPN